MTRTNRVLPTGQIVALPARGTFMGNRGILHDDAGTLGPARWRHKAWITCALSWKGIRRPVMAPGHYTALFFHDEAVACAAGHRPCALCRRPAFNAFRAAWVRAFGTVASAPQMDSIMHAARIAPGSRQQQTHTAPADTLPDGCFVLLDGQPCLVAGPALRPFHGAGYGPDLARPTGVALTVLTPAPLVAVMRAGWQPQV